MTDTKLCHELKAYGNAYIVSKYGDFETALKKGQVFDNYEQAAMFRHESDDNAEMDIDKASYAASLVI